MTVLHREIQRFSSEAIQRQDKNQTLPMNSLRAIRLRPISIEYEHEKQIFDDLLGMYKLYYSHD